MPSMDAVLLPICAGIALLGVILTALAWRRGNKGRVIQSIGVVLIPIALYFSGLLRVVWDLVASVINWAFRIVFTPLVWLGLSMLALCLVLWVVGGLVAKRTSGRTRPAEPEQPSTGARPTTPAVGAGASRGAAKKGAAPKQQAPVDEDLAEIEALLKKRGIE